MAQAAAAIELTSKGIDTAKKAIDLINEINDHIIPWKEFQTTMQSLRKYSDQYSDKAAVVVGQVAKLLLDCGDRYMASVNSVDRWCKSAVQLLRVYIDMFANITNKDVAEAQKGLMLTVLNNGHEAVEKAKVELEKCNTDFNGMSGKILELQALFNNDFKEGSAYYDSAVSQLRIKAYAGAASSAVTLPFLGPIGIAVAYSIAAGVVEGELIPNLKKAFKETEESFARLKETLTKAEGAVKSASKEIDQELDTLKDMASQIDSTKGLAEVWSDAPAYLFNPLKTQTEQLIQMCKAYSTEAEKKREKSWK